ncbi:hypothetical protein EH204_08755 [Pectobacterium carotovorum subsp. carotovorum]|nr:hypothetical protein EH204_08755 [Pectobacterium carotovorum subsp. carotovorum]
MRVCGLITIFNRKTFLAVRKASSKNLSDTQERYTRHTSSCMCVGCVQSPESLTCVSSSGFPRLPPS